MTTAIPAKIETITGRAVAVHGDDMDTDRIIPARFLKTITFEGIDAHLFTDARSLREQLVAGGYLPS